MFSTVVRNLKKARWLVPIVLLSFAACELDVSDPGVIQEEEVADATPETRVSTQISGLIGDLATATEHYSLYTSMFTDEMILAGTFPTRLQVDERRVDRSNSTVTGEVEENLQVARKQAEKLVTDFQEFQGQEGFPEQDLLEGIAFAHFTDALATMWLGQLWCEIPIDGSDPIDSNSLVQDALAQFATAEAAAETAGLPEWAEAAELGQARAHLWLGSTTGDPTHFDDAASFASDVDRDHRLFAEFSFNTPSQFNKFHELTFGSQNEVIRWTVGAGISGDRGAEKFRHFDQFVDLGIIDPDPGLTAFSSSIAVQTPLIYDEANDGILLSTGIYARLIEAEAAIRNGDTGPAQSMINAVRDDWDERWTLEYFAAQGEVDQASLTGNLEDDLLILSEDYAREMWLTGVRQATLRRFVEEFGAGSQLDLYPDKPGDQICWPVTEQEEEGQTPQ